MEKRKIGKEQYQWQSKEIEHFIETGILKKEQGKEILGSYEIEQKQSLFLRFVLSFGAILLGLGVLSFIASNWAEMSNVWKYVLLLSSLAITFGVAWRIEIEHPKTSRALHYLGILIYGASIFLIGQMFHFSGENYQAFLIWALGSLGVGYLLKDKWILLFVIGLLISYSIDFSVMTSTFPMPTLLLILPLVYINYEMKWSRLVTIATNLLALTLTYISVALLLEKTTHHSESFYWLFLAGFIFGLVLLLAPVPKHLELWIRLQANVILAVNGFVLTFEDVWGNEMAFIAFSLGYMLFVFILIKRGSLINILILSGLVLRFYVDISFDFMPKSLIFIVAGLVLLITGYFFEKKRRKGGGLHE